MRRVVARLFEVVILYSCTHAFLRCRGPTSAFRLLESEEHLLELHHPRVGEQQGRIVAGNERGARPDRMPGATEIIQKSETNLSGLHVGQYRTGPEHTLAASSLRSQASLYGVARALRLLLLLSRHHAAQRASDIVRIVTAAGEERIESAALNSRLQS